MAIGFKTMKFLGEIQGMAKIGMGGAVLFLGRPTNSLTPAQAKRVFNTYFPNKILPNGCLEKKERYAEYIFRAIGYDECDSMDISDFEGANVIHDLATPISDALVGKYNLVVDNGCLEHVFDYKQALHNAMRLVKLKGTIVLCTPGNNYFGHGFYQLSPDLFFSVFCKENGFDNTMVFSNINGKWIRYPNTRESGRRLESSWTPRALQLYVISQKISETPKEIIAYQSDYSKLWESKGDSQNKPSLLLVKWKRHLPYCTHSFMDACYNFARDRVFFRRFKRRKALRDLYRNG